MLETTEMELYNNDERITSQTDLLFTNVLFCHIYQMAQFFSNTLVSIQYSFVFIKIDILSIRSAWIKNKHVSQITTCQIPPNLVFFLQMSKWTNDKDRDRQTLNICALFEYDINSWLVLLRNEWTYIVCINICMTAP